jgi:hypothetical protein
MDCGHLRRAGRFEGSGRPGRIPFHGPFHGRRGIAGVLLNERVVVDRRLVTSRGAGTAFDFGLSLVEHLVSLEMASSVAQSVSA